MYEDLSAQREDGSPFDGIPERVSPEIIATLKARYAALPSDYLNYLTTVGWGSLGRSSLMIYSGPVTPDEIYGHTPLNLKSVLLVGDDFAGQCVGITSEGAVVIVDAIGRDALAADSFEKYIRSFIAKATGALS
jgi:hypothetical protein